MPRLNALEDKMVSIMKWGSKPAATTVPVMAPEKTGYLDAIGPQIGVNPPHTIMW